MKTTRFSVVPGAAVLALLPLLPGCIVGEIRDELKNANSQLTDVQTSLAKLDQTNEQIARTNEELIRTSQLIDDVQQGLGRIDETNSSLTNVDQRLSLLNSINTSLTHLDAHLASLRKTISSLDDSIPFLSFGGGDDAIPEPSAPAEPAAGEQPDATERAVDASAEQAPAEKQRARDPMVGAWVTRFPDDRRAIVFAPDGRFILSRRENDDSTTEIAGEWERDDRILSLTAAVVPAPEPTSTPAASPSQPAAAGATAPAASQPGASVAPPPPAPPEPVTRRLEIVLVTGRSVTVRLDGELLILVRP